MSNLRRFISLCVILLIAGGGIVRARDTRAPDPIRILSPTQMNENQQRIAVARQLINRQMFEQAAHLLEIVYEQDPENAVVHTLLIRCYLELKYYAKADMLTQRLIERYPDYYRYRVDLAEIRASQGFEDSALAAYDQALVLTSMQNFPVEHEEIIASLIDYEFPDRAAALIDSMRQVTGDPAVFGLQRAMVYEGGEKYREATAEYARVLTTDSTSRANQAERRLAQLLEFVESTSAAEKELVELADSTPDPRLLNMLASHLIRTEQFDRAFHLVVRQDSLTGGQGNMAAFFVRECEARQHWDQVVRMGAYLDSLGTNSPVIFDVLYRYARALAETGQYARSIEVYRRLAAATNRVDTRAEALYQLGNVYFTYLHDYPRALAVFDTVTTEYRRGSGYLSARLAIPYCHLRMGELDKARTGFSELAETNINEDMKEEVSYNLALLDFYSHHYDSSGARFRKLMVDYPRGYYVNDALRLAMLMTEAGENTALLDDYSSALLFLDRHLPDSARVRLDKLVDNDNPALADVALLTLIDVHLSQADSAAALDAIERLVVDFEDSYYAPFGMKRKADLLLVRPEGVETARELYRRLLKDYPNYPFISEVRKQLRELEVDRRIG